MKRILVVFIAFVSINTCLTSCYFMSKQVESTTHVTEKIQDIEGAAKNLSHVLANTLGLDNAQKNSLIRILTNYIIGTNGIHTLSNSNTKDYLTKLNSLNKDTLIHLKGLFTKAQYSKFLSLGGNGKTKDMLIKNLIGGSELSYESISVLMGLLK